jgi:hypothetical protein
MKLVELLKWIDTKLKYWDPVKQDGLGVPKLDWPQVKHFSIQRALAKMHPICMG